MSELPKFIKEFSKQEHAEERNEVAAKIRESRAESSASSLSESAQETVNTYQALEGDLTSLNETGLDKVQDLNKWTEVKKRLSPDAPDSSIPSQFSEPKRLLDEFYSKEKQRWAESTGNPEEMQKAFTEEHLASLSMEDYALLLKRFPSAMVTHVTRQGIRDHTGMFEHTKGKGEYANGFMQMMQDGKLKSSLAITAMEHGKEEAVAKALKLDKAESRDDAEKRLETSLSSAFDGYADRAAVHVATEEVADKYYGSEKSNEIFIAFPSAHIAAEHRFIGKLSEGGDTKNNDTWILSDSELDRGMNINAGIVFIPAEAQVDSETGSRYALDEHKQPIENEEVKNNIDTLLDSDDFYAWLDTYDDRKDNHEAAAQILKDRFGVQDPKLQQAVLRNSRNAEDFGKYYRDSGPEDVKRRKQEVADSIIESSGTRFKEAENTVSSQDFWESYYTKYPEQRPSKVEYYKGGDPTAALLNWKERHGLINSGTESSYDLGRRIDSVEEYQSEGKDRFRSLGEKIIAERFPLQQTPEVPAFEPPPPPPSTARFENESEEEWQARMRELFPPPPPPPSF
ncbi:MAG: hypothetical protein JWN64_351 [Parcubacteria group bacterium]|nr:hypothetical protein [Parcubacteria group bacterium]